MERPKPPTDLRGRGRRLWSEMCELYEGFTPSELRILAQACIVEDRMGILNDLVTRDGVVIKSVTSDEPRAHPALVELRAQSIVQARLFAALRLPDSDGLKPQHRQIRGIYQAKRNLRGA